MMGHRSARIAGGLAAGIATAVLSLTAVSVARADDDDDAGGGLSAEQLSTPTSYFETGFLWSSDNEYKFGDYTGLVDDGFYFLGNFDLMQRSPYDAELPYYYRLRGLNLGLDSRYAGAEYKWPGLFGLSVFYDEWPKYVSDKEWTFFDDPSSSYLMLPPGWVKGNDPTDLTSLDTSLQDLGINHKRQTVGGKGSLVLPFGMEFDASYGYQWKKGNKLVGTVFGTNGGDPRAFLIPEQVDYRIQQIESHLRYADERVQVQLGYYGSGFDNDERYTRFENPYLDGNWPDRGANGYPYGQKGQAPDNWFHQITGSAGLNLPYNSRFTLNTAFGWMTQDDDFLPYTINPNIPTPLGLPGDGLDGRVETRLVTAQFLTKPLSWLAFKAKYRWNERDNDTSVDPYYIVQGDVGDQFTADEARLNRPYSFEQHKVDVDASFDVFRRTKLTALYTWDRRKRNLQEVSRNDEHTVGVKLVSNTLDFLSSGARYEHSWRSGTSYDCVRPVRATEAVVDPDLGCPSMSGSGLDYENHPLIRKYYMADRERDEVHSWINLTPVDVLTFGFDTRFYHDDYDDSTYGLTDRNSLAPTVDVTWFPLDWLNFYASYGFEQIESKQKSITWSSDGNAFDTARDWSVDTTDTFHTVTAGVEVEVIKRRLRVGLDYLFAKSREHFDVDPGPSAGTVDSFPDNETELHDISVHADLQITENFSTRVGYLYEIYDSSDWAVDGICPGCLNFSGSAAVIGTGGNSPDYNAHVVSVSVKYEFW